MAELNSKLISSQSSFDAVVFRPCAKADNRNNEKRKSNAAKRLMENPPLAFWLLLFADRTRDAGSPISHQHTTKTSREIRRKPFSFMVFWTCASAYAAG